MQMQTDILNNNRNVYVYNGQGSNKIALECGMKSLNTYLGSRSSQVISVDASYFANPHKLVDAAVVEFFGGSAWEMKHALGEQGEDSLYDFLKEKKVVYVGSGAGAYLVSSFVMNGVDYGRTFKTKLNGIVEKKLVSPVYPLTSVNCDTVQAVPFNFAGDKTNYYVFWNGGGSYKNFNPLTDKVIAKYSKNDEIAAISTISMGGIKAVVNQLSPEIRLTKDQVEKECPKMTNKALYLADCAYQEALFNNICEAAGMSKTS